MTHMKNLFKTLSVFGCVLSLSLSAQNGSDKSSSQTYLQNVPGSSDAKSSYISNQAYLSKSTLIDYKNVYGDSLKGFDETKIKSGLLAKGLSGSETQIHMHTLKRDFINKKYNIGAKPVYVSTTSSYNSTPSSPNTSIPGGKPLGGGASINVAPCVNEDFELTTPGAYTSSTGVSGWTVTSRTSDGSCAPTNWTAGSSEFSIVATPILNWGSVGGVMGVIANSPLGGNNVAQLNDHSSDYQVTRIVQSFPVTSANTLFQFAYCGYWQDGGGGHSCCPISADQPGINVKMYDCGGAPMPCSSLSLAPGTGCQSSGVTYTVIPNVASWTNWQVKYIDLTPYIGTCVTLEFTTADCAFGGHWGSTLFDARCGGQLIGQGLGGPGGSVAGPVSFCAGSGVAQISAPTGYNSYQWISPITGTIAPPTGTMANLTITNPLPGSIYTVVMVAASGCIFTSTNALSTSTVNIAGIGSTSTCAGGASGSATVVGNGSASGYNYTWINALTSATVGTTSVASGLAPGTYSIIISGLGAAGCGSAVSTVTINTGPPGIIPLLKPFCNGQAYLGMGGGGTNYQWYNGTTAITSSLGGTLPTYTVTSPTTGAIYWLSYLSSQGCQDSVKFTLVSSTPGLMQVPTPGFICPGGNNGTATVNLYPAPGAPSGLNSYSVFAIGTTPAFNVSLAPTSATNYPVSGLSAGTYSVVGFDGSCKYGANFSVTSYTFSYNVSPTSPTLCPGNSIAAALTFTSPPSLTQYSYSWTPSTFIFGPNTGNIILTPTTPVGTQTTIVYTVVVTPSIVNCPVAKTLTITAINPIIPTFTAVPNMCNTSLPYQIQANPPGGIFSTGITGTNNPITPAGVISPSLATNGINSYTYAISVNTCVAKNTGTYQVSQFNTAALTSSVPPMCITTAPFNLMNIVQSATNGTWMPTTGVSANQFNPAGLPTGSYPITYSTTSSPNPSVCPHFTTISVAVTHTTLPLIQQVPEFCTNGTPITMTVSPGGGGWLPNTNSALSNNGIITPTLVPVPGMVVTYTVNVGPCVNSNTTMLNVSRFYSAGFANTSVPNFCYNNLPFNLMSIVQNTTNGTWSLPSTTSSSLAVQSNSFVPAAISQTGLSNFVLTYSTYSSPNPSLCIDSRTIAVSLLNPPAPNISQVGPYCNNASAMQLSVTPNGGSWTASTYLSSGGLFTPSLSSVGSNAVQYVTGNSTCYKEQTKFINIEAFVPATITSQIPNLCNNSPALNLTPMTLSSLGTWSGPGILGTNFNPALVGAGSFVLSYHTASSPGNMCPDNATVAVNVYSLAMPEVTKVGPFCNSSAPVQLQVSPIGGLFGGPNVGIVTLEGQFNPASALIGDNVVNYSITSGPCIAYAQTVIKVEKFISAGFAKYPGPFCKNSEAVNLDSYVQNPGGTWAQVPGVEGNMFYPTKAGSGNTNYMTYYTHSMPTATLCPDQSTVSIEVRDIPIVTASSSTPGGCLPVEVVFSTPNANTGTGGVWTIGDGTEPAKGNSHSHLFTSPGTYTVQFDFTDDIGCKANPYLLAPVTIHDAPKVEFTLPEEVYISDPQVQITNQSSVLSNNTYIWKVTGMPEKTDVNPTFLFSKIGKYQVTLTATSIYSCKNELTKTIEVKNNFNIFIPNSFSPNFDGLNDVFIPVFTAYGLDAKSYEMEIFDRWGHSIFRTKDITKGWDGKNANKEESLKEEVYIYHIKYKDMEGNAYDKTGHLSLVK